MQAMMSAAVGADFQFSTYPYHTVQFSVFVKVMVTLPFIYAIAILSLTIYLRTLGVQEKYVEAAGKTVDDEVMDL